MRLVRLTVGIVVLSLVFGGVAAGPASAQVNEDSGDQICEDAPPDGNSLVLVFPDETYVYGDESVTLLPETEADIILCSGGNVEDTGTWPGPSNGGIDGANVISQDDFSYSINFTDETASVSFESAIESSDEVTGPDEVNAPDVTVTPGRIASISVDGESFTVVVDSEDRSDLTDANGSYVTTLNGMQTAAGNLNNSAEDGSIDGLDGSLSAADNKTQALNDNYTQIQSILFTANSTGALNAYEERHNSSLAEVQENLDNAKDKIDTRTRNTAVGVLINLLGVLLAGAVVGAVGGWYGTNRVLADVEGKRRRSSAVDFRPKHLAGQAAVAVLFIGGAVALAVVLGLLNPIIVAIGAVIL